VIDPNASLRRFVQTHAFIHDDSLATAPFDEYSMHPALLAAPVVVTSSARFYGARYRGELRRLGAWPEEVIEPEETSLSPMRNLIADEVALDALAGRMRDRGLDLSTFYHDTEGLSELLALLGQRRLSPRVRPGGDLPAECATRSGAMALLKRFDIPTLPGTPCHDETEVEHAADQMGRVLIKADHAVPIAMTAGDACRWGLRFPVYVEQYVEVSSSPNLQWTSAGELIHLTACDQIVRNLRHVGNRSLRADVSAYQIDALRTRLEGLCRETSYEGPIGLDAVIDVSGQLFIVDINARFNSCTYPLFYLAEGCAPGVSFVYEYVEFRTTMLDDIYFDGRFLRHGDGPAGSLLVGAVAAHIGGPTRGGFLLTVAQHAEEADDVHRRNLRLAQASP
jgi:hypothetical protein